MPYAVCTHAQENFSPLFRSSPFLDLIGPIYQLRESNSLIIGVHIITQHCNARGFLHGGVISCLADIAMGYNTAFQGEEPLSLATSQLSIEYMGKAAVGDWLEVHTQVAKTGCSLAFSDCYFLVQANMIAKASAVFCIQAKK